MPRHTDSMKGMLKYGKYGIMDKSDMYKQPYGGVPRDTGEPFISTPSTPRIQRFQGEFEKHFRKSKGKVQWHTQK